MWLYDFNKRLPLATAELAEQFFCVKYEYWGSPEFLVKAMTYE